MKIYQSIRLRRKSIGMTQKELAKRTGLSVSYLSLIERGKRDPNISALDRIAQGLQVNLSVLCYLGATEDGLEKINQELANRLASFAFNLLTTRSNKWTKKR